MTSTGNTQPSEDAHASDTTESTFVNIQANKLCVARRSAQQSKNTAMLTTLTAQLRALLKVYEGKLDQAGLAGKQKLWMQFCLAPAYVQLRQCYYESNNLKRVFQINLEP